MGHHRDSGNRWSKQKWLYTGSQTADVLARKRCEDKTSDNPSISYQSSKRWQVHLRSQALSTRGYRCVVRCWQVQQCGPRWSKMIRNTFTRTSLELNVEPTRWGFPSSCRFLRKISRNKNRHFDKRFNNRKIVWQFLRRKNKVDQSEELRLSSVFSPHPSLAPTFPVPQKCEIPNQLKHFYAK